MNRPYLVFVAVWLLVIGVTVYFSRWAFTTIDVHRLDRSAGVVLSSSETASHVLESRTERSVKVELGLERGERIYLERWNGRIVSVVDRTSRHRTKTPLWPGGYDDRAYSPALGWSLFLGLIWLVWSLGLVVRRLLRAD